MILVVSFRISNAVALFMFEFRNPSSIIVIPEPTSALLVLGGVSMFGLVRRRTRGDC